VGGKIQIRSDGSLKVPDVPIIPYIEGDGVGPDIWKASIRVFDEAAVFEATHGTAPKYAGQDVINPGSLILSGAMMFDHLGWSEAAQRMTKAMETTIASKVVTYDLARQMEGAKKVKCSEFANAIIENL